MYGEFFFDVCKSFWAMAAAATSKTGNSNKKTIYNMGPQAAPSAISNIVSNRQ